MPNWKKLIVSGSDASLTSLNISGNLTASAAYLESASIGYLETIYETASVIYSSGSTKFGDTSDDTHQRTGSLLVSGAVTAHSFNISSDAVGTPSIYSDSNINLSASNAVVITSSPLRLASFTNAETGSITGQVGDIIYNSNTATYDLYSGSWLTILNETSTASLATTASHALNVPDTASHALTAITSSHTIGTASIANNATTSSYTLTGDGTFSGSFSGSFQGDATELNVNPFPFTGSGEMQGKLTIESFQDYVDDYVESYFAGTAMALSGDVALTGSIFSAYINANTFTGSLLGTASYAETASYYGGSITNSTSASLAETSSFVETAQTASFVETAQTASFVETAQTASYGNSFTASNLYVEGTASITYLESVYETSSIIYSSGSTKFGDDTVDTHERTGSVEISGSLTVTGPSTLVASQSLNNNTASGSLSFWNGSQTEYNLISASADNNTIYFVTA